MGLIAAAVGVYVRDLFALVAFAAAGGLLFRVVYLWPRHSERQGRRRRAWLIVIVVLAIAVEAYPVSGLMGLRGGDDSLSKTIQSAVREAISKPAPLAAKTPLVRWSDLLLDGGAVIVEIADDLPPHAAGSLLLEGESYSVQFRKDSCEWESVGTIKHPSAGTVHRHVNKAGPKAPPHLGIEDSGTATVECYSPRDRKIVIAGLPVDFNARGEISFGGATHKIGQLRLLTNSLAPAPLSSVVPIPTHELRDAAKEGAREGAKEGARELIEKSRRPDGKPQGDATVIAQAGRPLVPHIRYTSSPTSSTMDAAPYGLRVVIQTDATVSDVSFRLTFTGPIRTASFRYVTTARAGVEMEVLQGRFSEVAADTYKFSFTSPPFTPDRPIIVTVFSAAEVAVKGLQLEIQ